jgi:hypothetical protein
LEHFLIAKPCDGCARCARDYFTNIERKQVHEVLVRLRSKELIGLWPYLGSNLVEEVVDAREALDREVQI